MDANATRESRTSFASSNIDTLAPGTLELSLLVNSPEASPSQSIEVGAVQESEDDASAEEQHTKLHRGKLPWLHRRMTTTLMLVLPTAALICAIGHYSFFSYLDGTTTDHRKLYQSYVTTISLLLVTAFKSFIIAAVGLSFAQHLWRVLRGQSLSLGRIEQLFCIRNNPLELFRLRAALQAPVLFSMAVFVWLVPLAAIYPPAALTVSGQTYIRKQDFDIPVLFPEQPDFDPTSPEKTNPYRLGEIYFVWDETPETSLKSVKLSMRGIARSVLLNGEISTFPPTPAENMSYTLNFRGPQLSCETSFVDLSGYRSDQNDIPDTFNLKWEDSSNSRPNLTIKSVPSGKFEQLIYDSNGPNSTYWIGPVSLSIVTCRPVSVMYEVRIAYIKGNRQISYTKNDPQSFEPELIVWFPHETTRSKLESDLQTPEGKSWVAEVKGKLEDWNTWSLLQVSLSTIEYRGQPKVSSSTYSFPDVINSTYSGSYSDTLGLLPYSTFNRQRFNNSDLINMGAPYLYDITELTLNEYITNVTLSALSLDLGRAKIPVNVTEYRTTYEFSAPLNLILPYALCLAFCIVFVGLGIWSAAKNGVAAMDGGFLQVMATTSGRTRMETLAAAQGSCFDANNVPKDLLDLEVRYGELVDVEGVYMGIAGFGTIQETKTLRKM